MFKQLLSFSLLCLGLVACSTNDHSHQISVEEMNKIAGYETAKTSNQKEKKSDSQ